MEIESLKGPCQCGKYHDLSVKGIYIERGATGRLYALLKEGLFSHPVVICDENTKIAAENFISSLNMCPVICLRKDNLHADNEGVAEAENKMPVNCGVIIAVGSGTIHDISRYIANKREIPFISVPTAASVDGFVSTVAAMTWNGMKKTFPAVSPIYVFADTDIFSKAPHRLTASGLSDLLGKYTALADWEAANLATGEYICQSIVSLERKALEEAINEIDSIKEGGPEGCEKLMYALILSGLAMQMTGNSRPASGAEHHVSHFIEMGGYSDALHGEKVSVGLVLCLKYYHRLAESIKSGRYHLIEYDESMRKPAVSAFEKMGLLKNMLEENTDEPLKKVDISRLSGNMDKLVKIIDELPSEAEILSILERGGCKKSLEEIGIDGSMEENILKTSPFARNRLTINRLSLLIETW